MSTVGTAQRLDAAYSKGIENREISVNTLPICAYSMQENLSALQIFDSLLNLNSTELYVKHALYLHGQEIAHVATYKAANKARHSFVDKSPTSCYHVKLHANL